MYTDDFSPESIRKTAFFTGHRILSAHEESVIRVRLCQCLSFAYAQGYRKFFCGGALGFDTLAAFETIRFRSGHPDVVLSLAIPCADQADKWKAEDKSVYQRLLAAADEKKILAPAYYQGAMLTRNRYMVDRSSLCVCYLTRPRGGTASTVRYAMAQDRMKFVNLAMPGFDSGADCLREDTWNCTFISPSAGKNAVTAPLSLFRDGKLTMKKPST